MFSVCLSREGGCLPLVLEGVCHTPRHTHTPQADILLGRHPLGRHPLGRHPWTDTPLCRHTPLPSACLDTPPTQRMVRYTSPLPSACWDTVNKWAVCIPLHSCCNCISSRWKMAWFHNSGSFPHPVWKGIVVKFCEPLPFLKR